MSALGIFHTVVGVIAILVALAALFRQGIILPTSSAGKLYSVLTVVTCATTFGIFKTGKLSAGHFLSMLIVGLLLIVYAFLRNKTSRAQIVCMSATVFLSGIPTVIETLTRLPIGKPFASSPEDVVAKAGIGILFALFVVGLGLQMWRFKPNKV